MKVFYRPPQPAPVCPPSADFALTKAQTAWYQLGQEAFWAGYSPKGYLKLNQLAIPAHTLYNLYLKGWRDANNEESADAS